jgi:hypothetical protein
VGVLYMQERLQKREKECVRELCQNANVWPYLLDNTSGYDLSYFLCLWASLLSNYSGPIHCPLRSLLCLPLCRPRLAHIIAGRLAGWLQLLQPRLRLRCTAVVPILIGFAICIGSLWAIRLRPNNTLLLLLPWASPRKQYCCPCDIFLKLTIVLQASTLCHGLVPTYHFGPRHPCTTAYPYLLTTSANFSTFLGIESVDKSVFNSSSVPACGNIF